MCFVLDSRETIFAILSMEKSEKEDRAIAIPPEKLLDTIGSQLTIGFASGEIRNSEVGYRTK